MVSKKVWILAGALAVAGTAAAIAAVGHREGRFGPHRDHMDSMAEMGLEPGDTDGGMMHGPQYGGPGRHGFGMGAEDRREGRGSGRGWGRGPRSLTQDEFDTRVRERFARLDKNSDGVIDAAEIEAGMPAPRADMAEAMAQRFLAAIDASRDGKVTREEFLDRVKK